MLNFKKLSHGFELFIWAFTIIFAAFMCYQILRILFGGSWGLEIAIMGLVIANVGISIGLVYKMGKMEARIGLLSGELIGGIGRVRGEIGNLRAEFYKNMSEFSAEIRKDLHSLDKRVARVEHRLRVA
ncbi:hypothetical protein HYV82_03860 [Candidatus Woesearchaeota archaeon]|nr:hypothetical protein [Candidatus Woesearchaeota archaeon]